MKALRWRAAIGVVGLVLVATYVYISGSTSHIVQIDFTWGQDFLVGADVEIDGEVVGQLEKYGSQYVTGFEVEPGEHTVRVAREGCDGKPDTVVLGGAEGRRAVLMADVEDDFRCRVVLR